MRHCCSNTCSGGSLCRRVAPRNSAGLVARDVVFDMSTTARPLSSLLTKGDDVHCPGRSPSDQLLWENHQEDVIQDDGGDGQGGASGARLAPACLFGQSAFQRSTGKRTRRRKLRVNFPRASLGWLPRVLPLLAPLLHERVALVDAFSSQLQTWRRELKAAILHFPFSLLLALA